MFLLSKSPLWHMKQRSLPWCITQAVRCVLLCKLINYGSHAQNMFHVWVEQTFRLNYNAQSHKFSITHKLLSLFTFCGICQIKQQSSLSSHMQGNQKSNSCRQESSCIDSNNTPMQSLLIYFILEVPACNVLDSIHKWIIQCNNIAHKIATYIA